MHHVVELVGGVRVTIRTELRNQLLEILVAGFLRNVHSAVKWSNENKIQPPLARASVARNGRVFINSSWQAIVGGRSGRGKAKPVVLAT